MSIHPHCGFLSVYSVSNCWLSDVDIRLQSSVIWGLFLVVGADYKSNRTPLSLLWSWAKPAFAVIAWCKYVDTSLNGISLTWPNETRSWSTGYREGIKNSKHEAWSFPIWHLHTSRHLSVTKPNKECLIHWGRVAGYSLMTQREQILVMIHVCEVILG